MNKIYIANGKKYDVGPNSEQKFLTDFPNATLFEGPLNESESKELGKEESILPSASVEEKPALDMDSNSVDILLGLAESDQYELVENAFVNRVKDNNKEKLAAKLEELVKTYDAGRVENGLINPVYNAPESQIYQDRLAKVNKGYNDYLNFLLQSDYNRLAKKRKEELTPEIEQAVADEQEGGFFTGLAAKAAGFYGYAVEDTGARIMGVPVVGVEKVGSVDVPRTVNVSLGINNEKYLNKLKNLDKEKQRVQQMLEDGEINQAVFDKQIQLLYTDPTLSSGKIVAQTDEEFKTYINNKVEENNKRIVDNLIKTNESELKIIEKFGEEPVFTDEEGNIDFSQFTGKNIGRAVGTQSFQVLNSLLTMFAPGSGEYFQEAGASMSSALYKLAEEKAKAKNTTINQLSEAERMDLFEGIIENHELDYSAIQKNAMASAGVGTLGNFVQIFKIAKAIPVPVLNQIINGNLKRAIKNIGIKGLTYAEATIVENVTEQFQNYLNAQGVADATGLEYKFNKREAVETAVQTTLTTPLLIGGGRSVKAVINEGRSRIQAATDPNSIRTEFNRQTEAVKILKENGSITEKQAADQIDILYAAERELDASIFSKYEAKPRAEYYDLLIKEGQLNKRLEELKTTYKADDVFSAGETQSVENELSSIANKKIAINAQQQSKITLKKFVPYINANGNLYQKDGIDLKAYKFKTTEELTNFLKGRGYSKENINRMQNEIGAYDSKTHSMFFSEETLDSVFKNAIETGVVTDNLLFAGNVVHHEFGHALMVTMSDSDINTLIKNVRVETEKLPDNSALKLAFNAARKRVRKDYGDSDNRTKSEELISSISDFMSAFTEVTVDEAGFLSRVGKIIGDALDNNAPPFMDFSELQDPKKAKEFFVKYNSFIGQKRKSIPAAALEGAVRNVKIDDEEEVKFSKQELASEKVQQIYDEQGEAGAMDIIDLFKPITARLANKYRDVPGFDFEFLQSEIEIGKRGLFDLIRSYDPNKGVPLAAHINTNLSRRAIEAAQRILKTDFELDVTESKGVAATETATEIVEREEAPVEPATKIKSLRKEIGLPDELVETVKNAVVKTFGTKLPNPEDPKFRLELQKRFRTELKKPIAKFVGTRANYENFLRDNFEAIYAKLPQSLLNKRFDEFIEPVLDEDGKQLREKTAEGNKIFTKKKISKAEFIKYFLGAELGSSTKGARKTTIVEAIAEEMAFDATMEVLTNPDIAQKYQDIAELTDQPLPENFKALVAKQVDRAEDFKFSNALGEESGLSQQELNKILSMSLIDIAKGNPAIAEAIYDETWTKSFPRDFENIILPGLADAVKKQETKEEKAALVRQFIQLYSRPVRTASSVQNVELNLTKNDAILRTIRKALGEEAKGVIGFSGKQNIIHRKKVGGNTLLFYKGQKINAVSYDITDNATKQKIVDGKISKEEMLQQNNSALRNVKDIIFGLGVENPGLALTTLKLMQKDNRSEFRQAAKLNAIVKNYKGKLHYEHNPPTNIVYGEIVKYLENPTLESKDALINILNNWEANIVPQDFAEIVDQKYKDKMPEDGLRYKEAFEQTKYEFDGDIKFSKSLSSEFNGFLEEKTGIDKRTKISEKRAAMIGEGKGRFKFFLPPNAEDFMGLLYTTLLSGKRGDEQIAFYKEQLVDPFARGIREYQSAKEQTIRELKALKKAIKKVPTKLAGKNETGFTNEVAVRVYLWNKNGYDVPGLKKKEVKDLVRVVANNSDLREFALNINSITRGNGYPMAENNWEAGTITTDLLEMLNTTTRKESLAEFINNKDQIFSKDNLNKLQAAFGKDYRFALEDALGRMVSGRKRYTGIDKDSKKFLDWLNGAVGTIMFWNSRSAMLQMLSVVNYTNFSDNNIFNQVKTFADQKQYWTDWYTLMFSDFLKQRRAGSQLDVNINDIVEAAEGSTNPGKAIFAELIRLGYAPTQIADSFAISTGGAAFYRNRINKYKKDGLSDQEAQDKAFLDFQEITEETQQSSRDDRISQIQAGGLGRIIFAFANTPMQYARIIKRSSQDLINGRGDWKQNISRIAFYGALQNIIFSTLQNGLFALLIDGEDDDEVIEDRVLKALNSTADALLRGSGLPGAVLATLKNTVIEVFAELKKNRPKVWKAGLTGATSISPPVNSKVRKMVGALDRLSYKSTREDIMTKGLSLENPVFDIGGKLTSAITNAPADRLLRKTENIIAAMDEQTSATQALFLAAGWSKWDLNMIEKRPQKLKLSPIKSSSIKRPKLKRKGLKR